MAPARSPTSLSAVRDERRGLIANVSLASEDNMLPEVAEAIRIADKHLPGQSRVRKMALAKDIQEAICRLAGSIAEELIKAAMNNMREQKH